LHRANFHYDAHYGSFQAELYAQIRREAFGEDIGQNSWLTSSEQDTFLRWLDLSRGKALLDIACGSGGPALRIAAVAGCSVVGVDVHEQAISTAKSLAAQCCLTDVADFHTADATRELPFPDGRFGAITCIDAINHLPDRINVIAEWKRLLKAGGRLLFTDPIVVTGPLTNVEIAVRSSMQRLPSRAPPDRRRTLRAMTRLEWDTKSNNSGDSGRGIVRCLYDAAARGEVHLPHAMA
jgi:SAM-dependent methyltransferase